MTENKASNMPQSSSGSQPQEANWWRFIVLFAATTIGVILRFPHMSFSLMYSNLLMDSGVSSTLVTWINNLFNFFFDVSAIFVASFCEIFGWRKVLFTAGLILGISTIISGFIENPAYLLITYSLLSGAATGTLGLGTVMLVSFYFNKERGAALGFHSSGSSAGDFAAPPFLYFLQQIYGHKSYLFVLGALMLHTCVAALLFHPIEWHIKGKTIELNKAKLEYGTNHTDNKRLSIYSIGSVDSIPHKVRSGFPKVFRIFTKVIVTTKDNLKMLKYARVKIISLSASLIIVSLMNFFTLLPFLLKSRGIEMADIVWYISTLAIANIATAPCVSSAADALPISAKYFYMTGIIMCATAFIGLGFVQNDRWLFFYMVAIGICIGTCIPLLTLVNIEFVGLEDMPKVFGATGLFNALAFLIFGPIVGLIRDTTGSYHLTVQLLSVPLLMAFIFWSFMPLATRRDKRKYPELS